MHFKLFTAWLFLAFFLPMEVANAVGSCPEGYEELFAKLSTIRSETKSLKGAVFISASNVEKNLSDLSWAERSFLNPYNGVLTSYGPLGPNGPLQKYGPVGKNDWNPSQWISGKNARAWNKTSQQITENGGPLSNFGPLGIMNPANIGNDFFPFWSMNRYLREGSSASILGPLGPHGVYGANGPLGPVGAHGFKIDPISGSYLNAGKSVKEVSAGSGKSYELVEHYSREQAWALSSKNKLDSSFVLDGALPPGTNHDLKVNAQKETWISFLVIPERSSEKFAVELIDSQGKIVATSDSERMMNYVQIRVPAKTPLTVRVRGVSEKASGNYRLHVVSAPAQPLDQLTAEPYLSGIN